MAATLVRFWTAVAVTAIACLSIVLLPFAAHASTYNTGTYGDDIYNGSNITTTVSGGGTCSNCGSSSSTSKSSTVISATSSTSSSSTTSTVSNSGNSTGSGATTTTPYVCASSMAGGDLSLAQLVNLFVSLGIIPTDKAQKACSAVTTQGVAGVPAQIQFTKPLKLGSRDAEVHLLQVFLNTHGFAVAANGPGSSGNETDLYGILTKQAVARFQAAYTAEILTPVGLTAPSGFFGPSSMKKANALIGSK